MLRMYPTLIEEDFIFVFQDTRGRGASDGQFVSLSPMWDRSVPNASDESTAAYDSVARIPSQRAAPRKLMRRVLRVPIHAQA